MKNVFVLALLGLIFVACNPEKKYASQLTEIANFEERLDSLQSVIENIKFDSLVIIQKAAEMSEKSMKIYYTADTISPDLATKMQFNKMVRKGLQNITLKKRGIGIEMGQLRTQFQNLKQDIKAGLLKEEQIKEFLLKEAEAYQLFADRITETVTSQTEHLKNYYFAKPLIDEYIAKIKPAEDQ